MFLLRLGGNAISFHIKLVEVSTRSPVILGFLFSRVNVALTIKHYLTVKGRKSLCTVPLFQLFLLARRYVLKFNIPSTLIHADCG